MSESMADFRPSAVSPVALDQLVKDYASNPDPQWASVQVRGLSMDSKDLQPGEAFLALGGQRFHAAAFALEVLQLKASAIITDSKGQQLVDQIWQDAEKKGQNLPAKIPVVVVDNPRQAAAPLAKRAYGAPDQKLLTVGITGTNGKTTSCTAAWQALEAAGYPCALFGTAQMKVGEHSFVSCRTTLEAPVIYRSLALAVEEGCRAAVIEVSAHALSLHRIDGIKFDCVMFTNLQSDHLDYYQTIAKYFQAKQQLFTAEHARQAVICVDDRWGRKLAEECKIPHLTYRLDSSPVFADWSARPISQTAGGYETNFELHSTPSVNQSQAQTQQSDQTPILLAQETPNAADQNFQLSSPLPGEYNIQNLSGVFLLLHQCLELEADAIQRGFSRTSVPGRFQIITANRPDKPTVIVDYAHTPEALAEVLEIVRGSKPKLIHLVFGTDGDRDASKRKPLAQVAAKSADQLWVTDENPRTEDAPSIRRTLLAGIAEIRPDMSRVVEVKTCRRDAIRQAIQAAQPGEVVLITGKGSEPYQEINHVFHHFLDAEVAEEVLAAQLS